MVCKIEYLQLLWFFVAFTCAQAPQDPLKNFCRRYGHQTAVIDESLYIDGGWVYANPLEQNPVPTMSMHPATIHRDRELTTLQIKDLYTVISIMIATKACRYNMQISRRTILYLTLLVESYGQTTSTKSFGFMAVNTQRHPVLSSFGDMIPF